MENIPIKLQSPAPEFDFFVDNQVLTADQLNRFLHHFDRENRLTRTKTSGVGIICGLDVKIKSNGNKISVSKGAAITTDGDLLFLDAQKVFTHFRLFEDTHAKYAAWQPAPATPVLPLFRLSDEGGDGWIPLADFSSAQVGGSAGNLAQMGAVFYLESYLHTPENCTEMGCDSKAITQRNNPMLLLAQTQDLGRLQDSNAGFAFQLPDLAVTRVDMENAVIDHIDNLNARFQTAISASIPSISAGILEAAKLFGTTLGFEPNLGPSMIQTLQNQLALPANLTYKYHFLKDLVDAYEEFRLAVFDLNVACCVPAEQFPKHILLGELVAQTQHLPKNLRHYFIESPILNQKDRDVQRAKSLLDRIRRMISAFHAPTDQDIRITPSHSAAAPLGTRSIPIYYKHDDSDPLHEVWDFEKTRQNRAKNNKSYRANDWDAPETVKNALQFSIDKNNFFRIEGHLGQSHQAALAQISALRLKFNLGFRVLSVQIEKDFLFHVIPYRPLVHLDLETLFGHYRQELHANLELVDEFHGELNTKIADSETKDVFGADNLGEIKQGFVAAKTSLDSFKNSSARVKSTVAQPFRAFANQHQSFNNDYREAITHVAAVNANTAEVNYSTAHSPAHKLIRDSMMHKFDFLKNYLDLRDDAAKKSHLFENFFNQHPGLEHQSGVPVGGTFVIVYTATLDSTTVVADFCLPYSADLMPKTEAISPPPPIVRPTPPISRPPFWVDKPFLTVRPLITKAIKIPNLLEYDDRFLSFENRFSTIDTKFLGLDTRVSNAANDNILFKSDIQKSILTISTTKFNGGTTKTDFGNNFQESPSKMIGVTDQILAGEIDLSNVQMNRIAQLESKTNLNAAEKTQLETLKTDYAATLGKIIEASSVSNAAITANSDQFKAMNYASELLNAQPALVAENNNLSASLQLAQANLSGNSLGLGFFNATLGGFRNR